MKKLTCDQALVLLDNYYLARCDREVCGDEYAPALKKAADVCVSVMTQASEPSDAPLDEWPRLQYQKVQDFVIGRRLFMGSSKDKSHVDIVLELAAKALSEANWHKIADERAAEIVRLQEIIAK